METIRRISESEKRFLLFQYRQNFFAAFNVHENCKVLLRLVCANAFHSHYIRVVLEVDQPGGSAYLLEEDGATGSTYL